MSISRPFCCLPSDRAIRHRKNSNNKTRTHKTQKGRRRWQRSFLQITWKRKNWQNLRKRKGRHKLWKQFMSKRERKKVRLTPWGVWKPFDLAWTDRFKSTRESEIINDVEFNEAKEVFTAQCIQLKKDGQAKVKGLNGGGGGGFNCRYLCR